MNFRIHVNLISYSFYYFLLPVSYVQKFNLTILTHDTTCILVHFMSLLCFRERVHIALLLNKICFKKLALIWWCFIFNFKDSKSSFAAQIHFYPQKKNHVYCPVNYVADCWLRLWRIIHRSFLSHKDRQKSEIGCSWDFQHT